MIPNHYSIGFGIKHKLQNLATNSAQNRKIKKRIFFKTAEEIMRINFYRNLLCAISIANIVNAEVVTIETMDKMIIQIEMNVLDVFLPTEYGHLGTKSSKRGVDGIIRLDKVPAYKLNWLIQKGNEVQADLNKRNLKNPSLHDIKESLVTVLPMEDVDFMVQVWRLSAHLELTALWKICAEKAANDLTFFEAYKLLAIREFATSMPLVEKTVQEKWPEAFSESFKVWDS